MHLSVISYLPLVLSEHTDHGEAEEQSGSNVDVGFGRWLAFPQPGLPCLGHNL